MNTSLPPLRKRTASGLFAVLFFAAPTSWADIDVQATTFSTWSSPGGGLAHSLEFTFTPGDDGILIATMGGEAKSPSARVVWDDGVSQTPMIRAVSRVRGAQGANLTFGDHTQIFYLPNPAGGSGTIRVRWTPSVKRMAIGALYATGVADLESTRTHKRSGTKDATTDAITCSAGALLVDAAALTRTKADEGSGIQADDREMIYLHPAPVPPEPEANTFAGSGASYLVNGDSEAQYQSRWFYGSDPAPGPEDIAIVMASFAAAKPSDAKIRNFTDPAYGAAMISGTEITIPVPPGEDVSSLSPIYLLSSGATCSPESGSAQDFSNPAGVTYTVTSEDATVTTSYTVRAALSSGDGVWTSSSDGDFETPANWLNDAVPGPPGVAYFPAVDPAGPIVVTGGAAESGTAGWTFTSPQSYTVSRNIRSAQDYRIKVLRGEHTVDLNDFEPQNEGDSNSTEAAEVHVILDVAAGATLKVDGGISQTWTGNNQKLPTRHSGIRKTGPGTAVLQGTDYALQAADQQYSLNTEIDGGLLLANVSGSSVSTFGSRTAEGGGEGDATIFSSDVIVNDGGTLGGTGGIGVANGTNNSTDGFRLGGTVIVNAGGTIAPGDAPGTPDAAGTLTLNNGLTLHDGSKLAFQLGATASTSDLLLIPAGTFTGSPSLGGVNVSLADAGVLAEGHTFTLIDFDGAIPSGVELSDFQLAPGPFTDSYLSLDDNRLQVTIGFFGLRVETSGNDLVLTWDSKNGKLYNVRSETDPSSALPAHWPIFGGHADIAATPPQNTLSVPFPPDPFRLFVIEEFNPPPVEVLSDDFESGQGEWTSGSDGAGGTLWELGTPTVTGPAAAHSPVNCAGTNIDRDYGVDAEIWLRSPPLDLTAAGRASLSYWEFRDIEEDFDFGRVAVLDAADNSVLATIQSNIDGNSNDWTPVTTRLPSAALGKTVKIEFRFTSDDVQNFAGWYIDDVQVTVP